MLANIFKINECNICIYVKDTKNGYVILFVYVDNILSVGSDDKIIKSIKNMLNSMFDMKDMGYGDVILGVKILRTLNGLIHCQSYYVDKIRKKFGKDDSDMARTLLIVNLHLSKNKGELYRTIHSLYSKLSRYLINLNVDNWK